MNIRDLVSSIEIARNFNNGTFYDCKNSLNISDDIYKLDKIEQVELFFSKLKLLKRNKQKIIMHEIFGDYI